MAAASLSLNKLFRHLNMLEPKFRLFGGPNGSGKTHVFKKFKHEGYIHTEIYVNADKIEDELKKKRRFNFNAYRVEVDNESLRQHILQSGLYQTKIKDKTFVDHFVIRSGILSIGPSVAVNSYHGSFVASYLAEKLFSTKQSFAFETVMSHVSKVELMCLARTFGYKVYLYFIFADTIETNIARVQLRVLKGEHAVNEETIKSRAPRTFELLPAAFKEADSAYIIDNSDEAEAILIKEGHSIRCFSSFPDIIEKSIKKILKDFKGDIFMMK
jgi:predicted ABC-type ATPase